MFELDTFYFAPMIGLIAGLLVGAAGIGGAAFATPAMVLLLGIPPQIAIATDAVFCAVIKMLGLRAHRGALVEGKGAVRLSLYGSIPGAMLGVLAVSYVSAALLQKSLGLLLIFAAAVSLYRAFNMPPKSEPRAFPVWVLPVASFLIGFFVGLTSIGAGSLFLPLLLITVRLPFRSVVAVDIAQGLVLALVVGAGHLAFGRVDPTLLILLLGGGLPGILLGARLHGVFSARALASTAASLIAIVGARLVF